MAGGKQAGLALALAARNDASRKKPAAQANAEGRFAPANMGAPAAPASGEQAGRRRTGLRPPLKWAGGKRWIVPYLEELWRPHRHRRLVEPMCGGLSVALALKPARALLNDINPHLINFYDYLKAGLTVSIEMVNRRDVYYRYRDRFNELIATGQADGAEAALLFYYLNRTGYNGLCRFNQKGRFNVPFGRYKRIAYVNDFTAYRAAFAAWEFTARDFAQVGLKPGDFVYADPPYDVEFTSYAKEGFHWKDQVRAAQWLADHPGPVVLSNQATERIWKLYKALGFSLRRLSAPRMISCTGDRTPAQEVLAVKNL
jgi:DNA adenine methylase